MILFGLCMILLWLVHVDSCASFQFLSLGIMPMQVCLTASLHHHMPDSISHKLTQLGDPRKVGCAKMQPDLHYSDCSDTHVTKTGKQILRLMLTHCLKRTLHITR